MFRIKFIHKFIIVWWVENSCRKHTISTFAESAVGVWTWPLAGILKHEELQQHKPAWPEAVLNREPGGPLLLLLGVRVMSTETESRVHMASSSPLSRARPPASILLMYCASTIHWPTKRCHIGINNQINQQMSGSQGNSEPLLHISITFRF